MLTSSLFFCSFINSKFVDCISLGCAARLLPLRPQSVIILKISVGAFIKNILLFIKNNVLFIKNFFLFINNIVLFINNIVLFLKNIVLFINNIVS